MKKFIFSMICTLLPIFASAQVQNEELTPYAVLSGDHTVLKFFYDNDKESQGGMDIGPFTSADERDWNEYCESIEKVVFVEAFADCEAITSTRFWFNGCTNLTEINGLENLNTENVTDMAYMFAGCSSLTSLDLSNFNTSNVTEMQSTFSQCSGLETIYVGNGWSTENIESGGDMFTGCTVLVGGEGTTYDANHVDYTYAHIDSATNPGYLAEKLDYNEGDFFTTETVEGVTMSFRVDDATQRMCRVMAPEEDQRAIDTATTGTVTIPAKAHGYTVNRIHDYAFQDCAGVTEFVIPNSVKSIEQCAFKRCTSLTTVHIPASVTTIDGLNGKPWVGCTSLTTITVDEENPKFDSRDDCNAIMETADDILYMGCKGTKIPETTKVIGHSSFDSMGELPALEIPASVTSIVAYAFWECSFPSVTSYIEEPFETSSVWDHLPANCPLYVPQGKVEAYKAVSEWSNFTTIVEIGSSEAYAALNEDNTKLTFYYDNKKEERGGMSVGPFTAYEERGWNEQSEIIEQVVFDDSFAEYKPTSTRYWFYNFRILTGIPTLEKLKTDNVTDMSNMFMYCEGLTSLDVSKFETSNVTNMWRMFNGCSKLTNLDVSKFQTTKATSLGYMFSGCSELTSLDVSGFDTSNTTYMNGMFHNCSSLESLDVSHFETSKVTSMLGIFHNCSSLTSLDVTNFNTSNVTNMNSMFGGCSKLTNIDVSGFDTSNATDMRGMFYDCSSLTSLDVTNFNTSKVTTTNAMFGVCSKLTNLDLSNFNTSNVTDMQLMFSQCSELETIFVGDEWSTESVTSEENGANMFTECTALVGGAGTNYDANHVDYTYAHIDGGTSSPGYLSGAGQAVPYAVLSDNNTLLTFYYDDQKVERNGMSVGPFTLDVDPVTSFVDKVSSGWNEQRENIEKVVFDNSFAECTTITSTRYWFYGCNNLISIKGLENLKTNNVTNMSYMFNECKSLTSLDLTGFDTSSVTDMSQMFLSCSSLTSLDVTKFNTSEVTHMTQMFQGCSGLTSLDVSNFKTSKTINFNNMFYSCSSLKSLDVSGFDTSIANYMSYMFAKCASLTNLDLSNFNTSEVVDMFGMFSQCSRLETIYVGDKWSTGSILSEDRGAKIFEGCTALVGGAGTTYDTNHVDYTYAHIDSTTNPGYLSGSSQAVPYAALSDNNAVLTFYYDDQKVERNGMSVGPFEQWGGQGTKSGWSDVNEQITTVVFNNSFANFTKLTSTAYWFYGCENLTTITGMSNLKTDNVTDINSMFGDCHSLKSIDFSSLNLSNVTNMHQVFEDCRALESIDFSGVNTENVTNMGDLFLNCKSLKTIDISSFNTKNVTKMTSMFYKCDVLTTIYVGEGWTTENVTESGEMFEKSPNLVGGRGTTYDENHIGIEYAHIDGGTSNPGYLTDINGASEETWAKLQSRIEYGTDVLSKAKEISTIDQALIEKLDEALQNANQMYKIHEASEDEVLHMIEVLNERINDVEEAMNQPASEETWEELKTTIEYGTDVLAKAKEISTIDQWLIEELDMTLDSGNQMYKIHEASEEEVLNMIDELNWRIKEVEEAMNQPASDEAWAELNKAVETGEKLQTEAKGVSTVEPWALEELENMTAKGREMYKVHTAGEEEVRHMTEELNQIINEVEEMMRKQPQGEASFDGLTAYVSGNATLDDAFKSVGGRSEAAKTIAAIVWNADGALTADMLSGIDNPNLLVYVTEASKAPSGVQNVVIDGVASEIVLTDATGNNNFYCPQSFTAKSISYSHDFSQTTEIEVCRGWETIALPFDVQSITHESHGALVPFGGGSNGYPFWLRQLSTNGLARATKIEANRPYLICMPNNIIYPPEYNQNGTVTFSSSNVTVPVTSARSSTSAGVTLHATFQQVTKNSSVYALNVGETRGEYPEGSVFEQNYRDIRPFQAYTTHSAGTRSFITLESIGGNDDATGIEELRIKNSEFGDAEGVWYSLDGRRLDAKPTKKGVYVKDGRKIVIK
jgi:surface protein